MKIHTIVLGFVAVALVQVAVPLWQIRDYESILAHGSLLRFRVEPVDPADPFRGRYVRLRVVDDHAPKPADLEVSPGQWVIVTLRVDAAGFAVPAAIVREAPASGDYLRVRARWSDPDRIRLTMPFDHYYLDETLAPEVEERFRRLHEKEAEPSAGDGVRRPGEPGRAVRRIPAERGDSEPRELRVRVLGGRAVAESLLLAGVPVR